MIQRNSQTGSLGRLPNDSACPAKRKPRFARLLLACANAAYAAAAALPIAVSRNIATTANRWRRILGTFRQQAGIRQMTISIYARFGADSMNLRADKGMP